MLLNLFGDSIEKATLTDNGYDDFVVAISPDVPQEYFFFKFIEKNYHFFMTESINKSYINALESPPKISDPASPFSIIKKI